ncbi:hypothetical protein RBE51_20755 [Pseudomonas taiwanensis]|uniref:hypothetical protein n=1 Tax=Pseudomonas taiwanensis TaxID=470150 RepID=UPI0028E01D27|nr:hypothetical protein [Pseudomonas taiwanensis]MDT8925227.1 hypothetical protein [Pseudomonas taiwanensis]
MTMQKANPGLYARLSAAVAVFVDKQCLKSQAKALKRRQQAHEYRLSKQQAALSGKVFQLPNGDELSGVDLKVRQVTEIIDDDDAEIDYSLICLHQPSNEYYHLRWYGNSDEFQISACDQFYAEGHIRQAELAIQGIDYRPASQCSTHPGVNAGV